MYYWFWRFDDEDDEDVWIDMNLLLNIGWLIVWRDVSKYEDDYKKKKNFFEKKRKDERVFKELDYLLKKYGL